MFKECLKSDIIPFVVEDEMKGVYHSVLNKAQKGDLEPLVKFFEEEQDRYLERIKDLI